MIEDPRLVAGPDSPAWLTAMRDADEAAECHLEGELGFTVDRLEGERQHRLLDVLSDPSKSLLTGATCPACKLHRGHRVDCPIATSAPDLIYPEDPSLRPQSFDLTAYHEFLKRKVLLAEEFGFEDVKDSDIHPWLKPHQRLSVRWAVRGGRRALFESFGLGKTVQQLEIIRIILSRIGGRGLIVAPLGVRQEFMRDAETLGIELKFVRSISECGPSGIYLTNYETVRDGKLDPVHFTVASLDEATVLSGFGGVKTFREFMRLFDSVKYRFVATATPDPNEYIELLAYAAFLGIMEVSQAKTRWFKRDSTKADKLTLHPHKVKEFWMWVSSWALFLSTPSDLGPEFSDEGYDLPPLDIVYHEVKVDHAGAQPERDGQERMFRDATHGVVQAAREKRDTIGERIAEMRNILDDEPNEHFLLWHDLEDERHAIRAAVPDVVEVYGLQRASREESDKLERAIIDFSEGKIKYLAAKPRMFGAGANFQRHCARAIFCGIGYSFRDFFQAIHRIYRFLQGRSVVIHLIYAESETLVLENLLEKWERHKHQLERMSEIIREYGLSRAAMNNALVRGLGVERTSVSGHSFVAMNNDCVEELHGMEENSVHLILTSPPFSHMYEYSPNYSDFGHSDNNEHFFEQMDFLTPQLLRVLKPGRICALHVKDRVVPGGLTGLGFQTIYPFHAACIYHFIRHGFGFIGMKTVVTDVVRENNQTYRLGWSEQCKDGTKMGYGMPEYLLFFRKPPTDNTNSYADDPVVKDKPLCITDDGELIPFNRNTPIRTGTGYSRSRWQIDAHGFERSSGDRLLQPSDLDGLRHEQIFKLFRKWSSEQVYDFEQHVKLGEYLEAKGILPVTFMLLQPQSWHPDVWTDITRMRTLNSTQASKGKEMHLCAMQLDLVNRVIAQLSMPDETVLDPFGGLMTVPFCAINQGRRAIGIELSASYFMDGIAYCKSAEQKLRTPTLFDALESEAFESAELAE